MSVLLSPLLLAVSPVTIDMPPSTYDHGTQVSAAEGAQANSNTMKTTTFNGTQTFDWQGKPSDSDSDSDADQF